MLVSDLSGSIGPLDASVASQRLLKQRLSKFSQKSMSLSPMEQNLQSKARHLSASQVPKLRKPVSVLKGI